MILTMDDIPKEILAATRFVAGYAVDTPDWITVKKEILKSIRPVLRMSFTTYNPQAGESILNDFEESLIQYWEKLTGYKLIRPC